MSRHASRPCRKDAEGPTRDVEGLRGVFDSRHRRSVHAALAAVLQYNAGYNTTLRGDRYTALRRSHYLLRCLLHGRNRWNSLLASLVLVLVRMAQILVGLDVISHPLL